MSELEVSLQAAAYFLLALLGLLFNLFILLVLCAKPSIRTTTNSFVASITVANILLILLALPWVLISILAQTWLFGLELCVISGFILEFLRAVSTMSVAGIALDRYYIIVKPLTVVVTPARAKQMLGLIWWHGFISCLPPLVGHGTYIYHPATHHCGFDWSEGGSALEFTLHYVITTFILSLIMIICSYCKIYQSTLEQDKKIQNNLSGISSPNTSFLSSSKSSACYNRPGHQSVGRGAQRDSVSVVEHSLFSRGTANHSLVLRKMATLCSARSGGSIHPPVNRKVARSKTLQTILLSVAVFVLTWLPFYLLGLSKMLGATAAALTWRKPIPQSAEFIITWLTFSSVVFNPIIYGVLNQQFRKAFVEFSGRWRCCGMRAETRSRREEGFGLLSIFRRTSSHSNRNSNSPARAANGKCLRQSRDYASLASGQGF